MLASIGAIERHHHNYKIARLYVGIVGIVSPLMSVRILLFCSAQFRARRARAVIYDQLVQVSVTCYSVSLLMHGPEAGSGSNRRRTWLHRIQGCRDTVIRIVPHLAGQPFPIDLFTAR